MAKKENSKRTFGDVLRTIILIVALGVFCFSAYKLYDIWHEYKIGVDEYEDLQNMVSYDDDDSPDDLGANEVNYPDPPNLDWAALQAVNTDVIGWLDMRAIDISYPIAQGEDNDYYLHRTIEKTYNFAGSIFLDYENNKDFTDCNSIVYGHNMKNQSMFGKLKKYLEQETYDSEPYFWISTPNGAHLYQIFSVYKTGKTSDTYTFFSGPGVEFDEWIQKMKDESAVTTNVDVSSDDKIVTLSTCTSDSSVRCVVQAKKIN